MPFCSPRATSTGWEKESLSWREKPSISAKNRPTSKRNSPNLLSRLKKLQPPLRSSARNTRRSNFSSSVILSNSTS